MSIGILGKKLGMSQLFDEQGRAIPVTLIEAGPCRITQLKSDDTDGYAAVQIAYRQHCRFAQAEATTLPAMNSKS